MKRILSIILSVVMLLSTSVVFAEEPKGDGTPPRYYTFEELTGLSREDIDHIVIRSGIDGKTPMTTVDAKGHIKIAAQLIPQLCRYEQTVLVIEFRGILTDHRVSPPFCSTLLHFYST